LGINIVGGGKREWNFPCSYKILKEENMKIKMKATIQASANKEGSVSMVYKSGEVYDMTDKMNIATLLLNDDNAEKSVMETTKKVVTKMEKKSKGIVKKIFGKK
jgi:hypothetical protein